jgi:hypothetical protein
MTAPWIFVYWMRGMSGADHGARSAEGSAGSDGDDPLAGPTFSVKKLIEHSPAREETAGP